jgi:hypothetical protein
LQSCGRIPSPLYCGHGEEPSHASLPGAFFCQPARRFWPCTRSRHRDQRSPHRSHATARQADWKRGSGGLDQEDSPATRRQGLGRLFPSPRHGPLWQARPQKKEKTLGPGTTPKHEAHQKLADYIEEYTGKLIHQGEFIENFAELWKAFSSVKARSWGKKMREDMKYLFDKHVLPVLGQYSPRKITLTPLQLLVNKMAEDGYSKSAVKHIRTYLKVRIPRDGDQRSELMSITIPK